jgi:hypothetical protein
VFKLFCAGDPAGYPGRGDLFKIQAARPKMSDEKEFQTFFLAAVNIVSGMVASGEIQRTADKEEKGDFYKVLIHEIRTVLYQLLEVREEFKERVAKHN